LERVRAGDNQIRKRPISGTGTLGGLSSMPKRRSNPPTPPGNEGLVPTHYFLVAAVECVQRRGQVEPQRRIGLLHLDGRRQGLTGARLVAGGQLFSRHFIEHPRVPRRFKVRLPQHPLRIVDAPALPRLRRLVDQLTYAPEEWLEPAQLLDGTRVLYETVRMLDKRLVEASSTYSLRTAASVK
jgi:hypothetical protein